MRQALLAPALPPVHLAIYEWSGPQNQRLLQHWLVIRDEAAIWQLATTLQATERAAMHPSTALGSAKQFGGSLLAQKPDCWHRTLDISGDGKSNTGPVPRDVVLPDWATVNGLVIEADPIKNTDPRQAQIGELASYFQAWVIQGPDAFVETAAGFAAYERSMVRKLKRELQGPSFATGPVSPAVHTWNTKSAQYQRTAVRSRQ